MKKKIFLACAALVVSAAAVVGVKAYNYSQKYDFVLANIEALSKGETSNNINGMLLMGIWYKEGVQPTLKGPSPNDPMGWDGWIPAECCIAEVSKECDMNSEESLCKRLITREVVRN